METHSFIRGAVGPSTRRAYESIIRRFTNWYRDISPEPIAPSAVTRTLIANFLSDCASDSAHKLKHSTLATYRSALSTWWEEANLDGDNPAAASYVSRVLLGIQRAQSVDEVRGRAMGAPQKAPIAEVTPLLLKSLAGQLGADSPDAEAQMIWAAATCATYGTLRPGELLGGLGRDALIPEQITFHRDGRIIPMLSVVSGQSPRTGPVPEYFTVQLFTAKNAQFGGIEPQAIAGDTAVRAMWVWMHTRRALAPRITGPALFQLPQNRPLSIRHLQDRLASAVLAQTGARWRFTGKSFRKGGVSALMQAGADAPSMRTQGRWRSDAMPALYATEQSKRARLMANTQLMDAPGTFAGMESIRRLF